MAATETWTEHYPEVADFLDHKDEVFTVDERALIADWLDIPADKVRGVEFFVASKQADSLGG